MSPARRESCERVRTLVARSLDEPLAELERRLVEAHTAGCPGCERFDARLRLATRLLRTAPIESNTVAVQLPRTAVRRSLSRPLASVGAAVAVCSLALFAVQTAAPTQDRDETAIVAASLAQPLVGEESIRSLNRDALLAEQERRAREEPAPKPALPVIA